jgi:hypothetical protein
VCAYGEVDEPKSVIGVAASAREAARDPVFFDLGGELATPQVAEREDRGKSAARVSERDVVELEGCASTWTRSAPSSLARRQSPMRCGGTCLRRIKKATARLSGSRDCVGRAGPHRALG